MRKIGERGMSEIRKCSLCDKKHYIKGLCSAHYQKQYQKSDKWKKYLKQYRKQKAINDLSKEVNKYAWIKDKKAMVFDGGLADKRMKELKSGVLR